MFEQFQWLFFEIIFQFLWNSNQQLEFVSYFIEVWAFLNQVYFKLVKKSRCDELDTFAAWEIQKRHFQSFKNSSAVMQLIK